MSHSDFSGEYVLNRESSTLSAAGAASVRTGRVVIAHREPQFRYEFAFVFADGNTMQGSFELTIDGPEVTFEEHGQASTMRLYRDGEALVFTTTGSMTLTFRYELADEGRRLRMIETLRGTDHDQDNLWILDRV